MKHFILCCAALLCFTALSASTVTGSIKDKKGNILPFASILVKKSTVGTTANSKGVFSLQLSAGKYVLLCQHVGYKSVEKEINVGSADISIDFELEEQQYDLKDVEVKSGSEDPAYAIIRNAIKNREKHLKEVRKFQCEVYIKGQLKLRDHPKKILGQRVDFEDGDTSKRKMLFLSETVARYSVLEPNDSKIEVLSTRVSGNSDGFGLASPQIISFYENNIQMGDGLNPRGFISPISNNALNYYRYKFEGTFFENGKEISHIKVIPRRDYEPLFSGYIDIIEDEWRIHSVQLQLLKTSQMQFLDTLKIDQLYVPAKDVWVIKQQVIYPAGKFLGFDFHGNFVQVYDKFNLDPKFEKGFFNNTLLKIYDSANKKPKEYWDTTRPVALLEEEAKDYKKKDSLEIARKDPKYLDSLDRKSNKPNVSGIILSGYTYSKRKSKLTVSFDPLLDMINYNTVEGAVVNFSPAISKSYEGRRSWRISPTLRYGFSNDRFNAHISGNYNFGKKYFNSVSAAFGSKVFQFNNAQPITPRMNTLATLYWRNNFMKIYEAGFVRVGYTAGLGDGFNIAVNAQYQDRRPLENTSNYSWRKLDDQPFTPNYPTEIVSQNIPKHQSFVTGVSLSWQPGSKYMELPNRKVNLGSDYPRFNLSVAQGIEGLAGSDVNFTKWRFSMNDDVDLKIGGRIDYRLATGGFLNADKIYLPDFQHYQGNRQSIAAPYLNSFQLMSYYGFSNTAKLYGEAHVEYHLNGLLSNKIPLIRKWNWFFVTGTNSLFINKDQYHSEVFFGIENILKVFRVDYIYAFEKQQNFHGIRFSLPFLVTGNSED
jgi:hypothetical protein